MIDASAGFMKDGPKNRLRAQDIHRIVDVFTRQAEMPGYARLVGFAEIEKNEYNLNLPRYIDSQQPKTCRTSRATCTAASRSRDVEALDALLAGLPGAAAALFRANRPGYLDLAVEKAAIKTAIFEHPEFAAFIAGMNAHFAGWRHGQRGRRSRRCGRAASPRR